MIVTLAERKARALSRLEAAAAAVRAELTTYARARGGRFTIFGSFARRDLRPGSDFDVMVDFPADLERAAREMVETTCRAHGLVSDAYLKLEVSDALMIRIARDGVVLP